MRSVVAFVRLGRNVLVFMLVRVATPRIHWAVTDERDAGEYGEEE
jgi:hypothetical protein